MTNPICWLLLVISLPTSGATARMRTWRNLKTLGGGALRDGVYVLPDTPSLRQQLAQLAEDIVHDAGTAWVLDVVSASEAEAARLRALFDRREDYDAFTSNLATARATLAGVVPQDAAKLLRKLRRDYESLRAIDYFPNDASARADQAWRDFSTRAEALLATGEPRAVEAAIPLRDTGAHQGCTWATRRRLWVDRVASAWLIRRHIDAGARFLWLESPADCPPDALGFDFDGAAFTHVGERVSFEVLLASFGLDDDPGLARLGTLVRSLDTGQGFVAEAAGFEAMLAGLSARARDDDALLADTTPLLDALYQHYKENLR